MWARNGWVVGNAVLFKTQSAALFGIDAYLVEVDGEFGPTTRIG